MPDVAHHQTSPIAGGTSHGGSLTVPDWTLTAGTDLVMIVFVVSEGSGPTGIDWNTNESFTKVLTSPKAGGSFDENIDVWRLEDPTATTADIAATFAGGGNDIAMWAQVYENYSAVGDTDSNSNAGGTELTASVTTTVAGSMVVGVQSRSNPTNPDGWEPGTDVNERMDDFVGAAGSGISVFGGDMSAPSTGTYDFTADHESSLSDDFNVAAIEIQPTEDATPVSTSHNVPAEHLESGSISIQGSTEHLSAVDRAIIATAERLAAVTGGEERTNLIPWSSDFSQGWTDNSLSREDATSIIPGQTASEFTASGGFSSENINVDIGTLSGSREVGYTVAERVDSDSTALSIYDHDDGNHVAIGRYHWPTGTIDLGFGGDPAGTDVQGGSVPLGTGPNGGEMVLIWVSGVPVNPGNDRAFFVYPTGTGTNTDTAIIHHAQMEEAETYAGEHIVTSGEARTVSLPRPQDSEHLEGVSGEKEGVLEHTIRAALSKTILSEHVARASASRQHDAEHLEGASREHEGVAEHLSSALKARQQAYEHLGVGAVQSSRAHFAEHIAAVSASYILPIEVVASVDASRGHDAEHLAGAGKGTNHSLERLASTVDSRTHVSEHLRSAIRARQQAYERLGVEVIRSSRMHFAEHVGRALADRGHTVEWVEPVTAFASNELEVKASLTVPLAAYAEHLAGADSTRAGYLEHLEGVAESLVQRSEHLGRSLSDIDGQSEHLSPVSGDSDHNVERMAGATAQEVGRTEHLQGIAVGRQFVLERLGSPVVRSSRRHYMEYLSAVARAVDAESEHIARAVASDGSELEHMRGATRSRGMATEHVEGLRIADGLVAEHLASMSQVSGSEAEHLASVVLGSLSPYEAMATVVATRAATLVEHLASLDASIDNPYEHILAVDLRRDVFDFVLYVVRKRDTEHHVIQTLDIDVVT